MKLVWPSLEYLPSYIAALERGWLPDNQRGQIANQEELARIAAGANAFSRALLTERRLATQSRCQTGRRSRGSLVIGDGCGTVNFAAPSGCAGSAERRRCLRTVWDTSVMPW